MIDIAQVKIGDRWFLRFEESLTPVDSIEDIMTSHAGLSIQEDAKLSLTEVKSGQIVVRFKGCGWAVRTPVKPEYMVCLCGRGVYPKPSDD